MHKEYHFGVGVGKGVMASEISSLATQLVYFVVRRAILSRKFVRTKRLTTTNYSQGRYPTVTSPKQVTKPSWGPPPPCKRALKRESP